MWYPNDGQTTNQVDYSLVRFRCSSTPADSELIDLWAEAGWSHVPVRVELSFEFPLVANELYSIQKHQPECLIQPTSPKRIERHRDQELMITCNHKCNWRTPERTSVAQNEIQCKWSHGFCPQSLSRAQDVYSPIHINQTIIYLQFHTSAVRRWISYHN